MQTSKGARSSECWPRWRWRSPTRWARQGEWAFWWSLRHQWLYLHELDSMNTLRSLVDFYVTQHNTVMPHAAFNGATPDEVFSGTAGPVGARLAHARDQARRQRLQHNRSRSCETCAPAKLRSDHEGVAVAS